MFDVFGIIDWRNPQRFADSDNPFVKIDEYRSIEYEHALDRFDHGSIFALGWKGEAMSFAVRNGVHLHVYGHTFTNNRHRSLGGGEPHHVTASEILELYAELGGEIIERLKGSYVLIIIDEERRRVELIADRLNVLPLYYSCKEGYLAFSSSIPALIASGAVASEIDTRSVVEFAMFDYCLRDHTFFSDVRQLEMATVLTYDEAGLRTRTYFSVDELFTDRLMPRKEALDQLVDQLRENVNLHCSDADKFLLSLTGGFDGRGNLALLDRPVDDFLLYSYGMPGSTQLSIPKEIAGKLGYNYRPLYLEQDFEERFVEYAERAVMFSNGVASIWKANFLYAFDKLNDFSRVVVTGLFGSEVLRPVHNLGIQINDNSESIFMGENFEVDFDRRFDLTRDQGYYQPDMFDRHREEIKAQFRADYFDRYTGVDSITRFFFFIIGEGVRKFFMEEIQADRAYVSKRFPYWDWDLVNLIYKTPFAGMYNGALKHNPVKRRRAQILYAHAIHKYRPELGAIKVDRGYKPDDLLSPLYGFKILPGYLRRRRQKKLVGNDTFDIEKWSQPFFETHRDIFKQADDLFTGNFDRQVEAGKITTSNQYFSKVYSLKYFLNRIGMRVSKV